MTYAFPDTAGLERAQRDSEEFLYKGALGSNKIFHTLRQTAGLGGSPRWDLYLINLYTLVRNAYSAGIKQAALEKIVDDDVDLYMTFIGAYCSYRQVMPAVVLFYAPDYRVIPQPLLRVHTGQRLELDSLYEGLKRKLPLKLTDLSEDALTRKYLVATRPGSFPHKELPLYVKEIFGQTRAYGMRGTALISHCPVDFHIVKSIPTIELMESYTGLVIPPREFGRKLTKVTPVSFTTATHRLFGDDVHLAPLVKGKDKATALALAETRHWAVRTEHEIIGDITAKFPAISVADLTGLRL